MLVNSIRKSLIKTLLISNVLLEKKIRNVKSKQPCDYWRYVNSLNSRSKTPDVDMNLLFDFFKDLNYNDTENVDPIDPDFPTETFAHSLDEPITENEVLKAIKHLKSGKSKGLDNVSNEYIIHSSHVLTKLYVKLINDILDSSCIPEYWYNRVYSLFVKNKGSIEYPENTAYHHSKLSR